MTIAHGPLAVALALVPMLKASTLFDDISNSLDTSFSSKVVYEFSAKDNESVYNVLRAQQ